MWVFRKIRVHSLSLGTPTDSLFKAGSGEFGTYGRFWAPLGFGNSSRLQFLHNLLSTLGYYMFDGGFATFLSWSCKATLSPPQSAEPQVSADPSARDAASAQGAACTCCTFLSCSSTALLSPPYSAGPQVTTDPSARIAANA